MRNLVGTCSLLLLSAPAFAQSAATYIMPATSSSACPAVLSAGRLGGEQLLQAQRPEAGTRRTTGIALRLSLFSAAAEHHGITAARITLHGMTSSALLPAGQPRSPEGSESLPINPERVQHDLFRSVVYTHKLTGIQTVELNEVTYDDGSTWHEVLPGTCVVRPNPFMRVDTAP